MKKYFLLATLTVAAMVCVTETAEAQVIRYYVGPGRHYYPPGIYTPYQSYYAPVPHYGYSYPYYRVPRYGLYHNRPRYSIGFGNRRGYLQYNYYSRQPFRRW